MNITDALLGEHAVMYELFEYIRDTAKTSDDVQEIYGAVLVLECVLLSHARIEEDMLFPELKTYLGSMGPLAVMRGEHQEIEDLLTVAKVAIDVSVLKSTIDQFLALTDFGTKWSERRRVVVETGVPWRGLGILEMVGVMASIRFPAHSKSYTEPHKTSESHRTNGANFICFPH